MLPTANARGAPDAVIDNQDQYCSYRRDKYAIEIQASNSAASKEGE